MVKNNDNKTKLKTIKKLIKNRNPQDIYTFLVNNMDTEEKYMNGFIKIMCEQKNLYYICKTTNIITLSNKNLIDLINVVIESEKISYIKELLSFPFNRDYTIKKICELKNPYIIYELLMYSKDFILEHNITRMINTLCDLKEYQYIIKVGSIVNLSEKNIIKLTDTLISCQRLLELVDFTSTCNLLPKTRFDEIINIIKKTNYIPSIYSLAKIYYDRYNKINKELITQILKSREMKYICLVALYIDNNLIYKLFNNVNSMYQYMCGSGYYSTLELKKVTYLIYGESFENGSIMSEKQRLLKVVDKIVY